MFALVNYLPSTTTHYGMPDGQGNTWPACGQRIGRFALPWPAEDAMGRPLGHEAPTCKRCAKLGG